MSTIAPNIVSTSVSASTVTDPTVIGYLQLPSTTVDIVDEMIHEVIHVKPIQEEGFRSIVDNDHFDRPSEKIENQNVTDCVKFIRAAISGNDPQSDRVPF